MLSAALPHMGFGEERVFKSSNCTLARQKRDWWRQNPSKCLPRLYYNPRLSENVRQARGRYGLGRHRAWIHGRQALWTTPKKNKAAIMISTTRCTLFPIRTRPGLKRRPHLTISVMGGARAYCPDRRGTNSGEMPPWPVSRSNSVA